MDLSVIILNWNTRALLEKCLRSLVCADSDIAVQIIVADNNSEDGSRDMVRRLFPNVLLVHNPTNPGFGAGNNAALPHTSGRYVLFLNSDTVVTPGALSALVRYADSQSDIGILGPRLLNGDGSLQYSCRRYPNLGTGFFRNTPLGRLFPNNRYTTDYLMQDWDHASPRDVEWVSGAALMIRSALLNQIGGFDDAFYMYCEDVDLCWRANHAAYREEGATAGAPNLADAPGADGADDHAEEEAGALLASSERPGGARTWRVTYFPDAVIYHYIGKSSDLAPTRMTYHFHRSQHLFYKKHYAARTPLWLRPIIPVGIWLRAAGKLLRYRIHSWTLRLKGRHRLVQQVEDDKENTPQSEGKDL